MCSKMAPTRSGDKPSLSLPCQRFVVLLYSSSIPCRTIPPCKTGHPALARLFWFRHHHVIKDDAYAAYRAGRDQGMAYPVDVSEIHALNLRYLMLAQKASRENPATASRLFGLSASVVLAISEMEAGTFEALADTNTLLFKGKLSDAVLAGSLKPTPHRIGGDAFEDFTLHYLSFLQNTARNDVPSAHQVFGTPLAVCEQVSKWSVTQLLLAAELPGTLHLEGILTVALLNNFQSTQSSAIRAVMSLAHSGARA